MCTGMGTEFVTDAEKFWSCNRFTKIWYLCSVIGKDNNKAIIKRKGERKKETQVEC